MKHDERKLSLVYVGFVHESEDRHSSYDGGGVMGPGARARRETAAGGDGEMLTTEALDTANIVDVIAELCGTALMSAKDHSLILARVSGNVIHYFGGVVPEGRVGGNLADKRGQPKCQLIDDITINPKTSYLYPHPIPTAIPNTLHLLRRSTHPTPRSSSWPSFAVRVRKVVWRWRGLGVGGVKMVMAVGLAESREQANIGCGRLSVRWGVGEEKLILDRILARLRLLQPSQDICEGQLKNYEAEGRVGA
ncbi:hypothetical protein V496_01373 [Pseudogymnoascus sp. VKM F-4515 (FW-2607)]|nr:hypothetical protein V496_01373 [Pseudogymnoascus sp. VKM F-4515 (FW-2607)]